MVKAFPWFYIILLLFTSCKKKDIEELDAGFNYSATNTFINIPVKFNSNSIDGVIKHEWHFGDGESSTIPNPNHTFKNNGSYIVEHKVYNVNNEFTTKRIEINIHYLIIDTILVTPSSPPNNIYWENTIKFGMMTYFWLSNNYDSTVNLCIYTSYKNPFKIRENNYNMLYEEYYNLNNSTIYKFKFTSFLNPYDPEILEDLKYNYKDPDSPFEITMKFKKVFED